MLIHDKNKQIVLSRNAVYQYKKLLFFYQTVFFLNDKCHVYGVLLQMLVRLW